MFIPSDEQNQLFTTPTFLSGRKQKRLASSWATEHCTIATTVQPVEEGDDADQEAVPVEVKDWAIYASAGASASTCAPCWR